MKMRSKALERLSRALITLLGAGLGAALAMVLAPLLRRVSPQIFEQFSNQVLLYVVLCLLGALIFFALSMSILTRCMKAAAVIEQHWEKMPNRQIVWTSLGLLCGLAIAALFTQLILSAGASLLTLSFSALTYIFLGYLGLQIGNHRYHSGKHLPSLRRRKRHTDGDESLLETVLSEVSEDGDEGEDELSAGEESVPCKVLDTSVIIDGRILDVLKTGFLEGKIVVPSFVLAELRHIADSGDSLRRARGRRGLDVLNRMQKELKVPVTVMEKDYPDIEEVDVKLLRLCRENGGTVVTNDYNLNKVAGVTGIRVLNINDLANAVKPMLMAGEELRVQIVREGKEPGQGVAYLDDGTMIVVENGRRHVGEQVAVVVTTVLQTSAGRMIFSKLKSEAEGSAEAAAKRAM